jgi:secondary thiamine-phosphate synthase enzyme
LAVGSHPLDAETVGKNLVSVADPRTAAYDGRDVKQHLATIEVSTSHERELVDITHLVRAEVQRSAVRDGTCALYAQGATAALMIQENDDPNITLDVLDCLDAMAPPGRWRHDRVDNNGSAHIQAGIVGPSEVVPIRDGSLALSTWQNIFLCDFDGPRRRRTVVVTIQGE